MKSPFALLGELNVFIIFIVRIGLVISLVITAYLFLFFVFSKPFCDRVKPKVSINFAKINNPEPFTKVLYIKILSLG